MSFYHIYNNYAKKQKQNKKKNNQVNEMKVMDI